MDAKNKLVIMPLLVGLLVLLPVMAGAALDVAAVTQNANTTLTFTITGVSDTNEVNGTDIVLPSTFVLSTAYNTTEWNLTTDGATYAYYRNGTAAAALGAAQTADFVIDMASSEVGTHTITVTEYYTNSTTLITTISVKTNYGAEYSTGELKEVFVDIVGVVGVEVKNNAGDIVSMVIIGIIVSIASVLLAQVFGIIDLTKFIKWGS